MTGTVAQWIKPSPVMLPSLNAVPAALLPNQFCANEPRKVVEYGPSTWASAPTWEIWVEI